LAHKGGYENGIPQAMQTEFAPPARLGK